MMRSITFFTFYRSTLNKYDINKWVPLISSKQSAYKFAAAKHEFQTGRSKPVLPWPVPALALLFRYFSVLQPPPRQPLRQARAATGPTIPSTAVQWLRGVPPHYTLLITDNSLSNIDTHPSCCSQTDSQVWCTGEICRRHKYPHAAKQRAVASPVPCTKLFIQTCASGAVFSRSEPLDQGNRAETKCTSTLADLRRFVNWIRMLMMPQWNSIQTEGKGSRNSKWQ